MQLNAVFRISVNEERLLSSPQLVLASASILKPFDISRVLQDVLIILQSGGCVELSPLKRAGWQLLVQFLTFELKLLHRRRTPAHPPVRTVVNSGTEGV